MAHRQKRDAGEKMTPAPVVGSRLRCGRNHRGATDLLALRYVQSEPNKTSPPILRHYVQSEVNKC